MPPDVATELASQVLPSLASAWHQRLAELFGGGPGESGKSKPEPPAASAPAAPAPAPERSLPAGRLADDLLVSQPLDRPQSVPEERDWHEALAHWTPEQGPPDGLDEPFDEWRAADHAKRAGNLELAAEKYAQAAERAARAGSHVVASDYAERALAVLRDVPDNERTRRVMVAALMSLGRARWQGAGSDDGASLSAALQSLDECKELLDDSAPAALRAELGSLIAEVCYDMGSPRALERALDELTASGKQLLEANQPLEAARLLNDEAAVWVQIGDPVRAHYLLSRSREVFRHVLSSYAPAARELAQTEHMLARLLLHAKPRPGRAQDALKLGIEHAKNAEQAYHDFKDQRCEARVWETLGRLEMRAGHPDRAAAHLEDAIRAQEQLGDHVGLARSTGALAELLHTRGESARALQTLSDSIQQNLSTGSRGGLRFNLKGLRALAADLPDDLAATGRELEQELLKRLGGS
jgi:tetratricopeptide (TPR) repeat protein